MQQNRALLREVMKAMAFIAMSSLLLINAHAKAPKGGISVEEQIFKGRHYIEVTLDIRHVSLSQLWINPENNESYASFNTLNRHLRKSGKSLDFAINSGIYTKEYTPLGLYIENYQVLAPLNLVKSNRGQGNFALLPNGVFYIDRDNRAHVADTESFKKMFNYDYSTIKDAVQSGPMLLIDGKYNPYFIEDSDSLRIRSGVCTSDNGEQVHFAVTEDRVNFYDFATYFKEELQCENALYLDGTLARIFVNGRVYGASFWQAKPLVGIWSVISE